MVELDNLAEKVFALLKGNGLSIKIFDDTGAEVIDPMLGRRFFVAKPNVMVTIDEESNSIEFNKSKSANDDQILALQKSIKRVANEFLMNFTVKVFGRTIQPKDYSYQVKKQKEPAVMENTMTPVNHHLLGEVLKKIQYFGNATAGYLADNLDTPMGLADIQRVLNRLVKDGKITANHNAHGEIEYSVSVEEAVMEDNKKEKSDQLAHVMSRNAVTGQDNRRLTGYTAGNKHGQKNVPRISKFSYPDEPPAQSQKKKITPFEDVQINELSTDTLGKYKKAASADASKADKEGNFSKGDKRFAGIVKATKKQFDNDSKKSESIKESFSKMFGSARTSQQTLENVRILVKHKTPVSEEVRGSRTRHISAIFLECNGERMRFQHNYLPGARAMAQHMAHGGSMTDKVGAYINESTGNLLKLQSFNRYVTTNKLINEDSSGIVETVKENIETIRTELKKLTGTKTYETAKARLETFEREALAEDDTSGLKDLFTIRRFDEKFEEVLPIVKQLVQERDTYHKRIEEVASQTILLKHDSISAPMLEFASEHAKLGFNINQLAMRILENDELAGFINKIGSKLCKEGTVNEFEKAVLSQVLENAKVVQAADTNPGTVSIKESADLENFFNSFDYNFM